MEQASKLWVELKEDPKKMELRFGIDDTPLIGASRKGNRGELFALAAENNRHFTIVSSPESQRITFHETEEHVAVIGGVRVSWNEPAKAALVLSIPYIEHRLRDERFLTAFQGLLGRSCRFMRRPRDFRGEGICAVFPTPTSVDFQPVSETHYELQIARFGPQPVEALWQSTPGALFLAVGDNLQVAGMTTLIEDGLALLLRHRDVSALLTWFVCNLSEPASPPLDFFADL